MTDEERAKVRERLREQRHGFDDFEPFPDADDPERDRQLAERRRAAK